MKDIPFRLSYFGIRLLLLHRADYRNQFTKRVRKIFKRFGLSQIYDAGLWRIIELPEYLFSGRLSRIYREDMTSILETMKQHLPENPQAILDIGAGMGGIDLVLYHHFTSNPSIYLLDKDGVSEKLNAGFNSSSEDFSYYNSFKHARLFLKESGVPDEKINTIDIDSTPFPTDTKFDLVVSFLSWGFHFPISTYIQEVYNSLNQGGTLVVDIRKGTDGVETITKIFGSIPDPIHEEAKYVRVAIQKP